jgi:hypothetical protein
MIEIYVTLIALFLIFASISAYFSIKSWILWRKSDITTIKAKVFLDKSFLDYNYKLVLFAVWFTIGLILTHLIMEYVELTGRVSYSFYLVYYSLFPVAMLSVMLVTYMWYKLLSKR